MIRFDPEALDEIERAIDWYNAQRPGLGAELGEEIAQVFVAIEEAPQSFVRDRDVPEAHRAHVARFPYGLVFMIDDDGVVFIVAFAHGRRRPSYWARRVRR